VTLVIGKTALFKIHIERLYHRVACGSNIINLGNMIFKGVRYAFKYLTLARPVGFEAFLSQANTMSFWLRIIQH
jgi:hypothetical protein